MQIGKTGYFLLVGGISLVIFVSFWALVIWGITQLVKLFM